ncbi:hypothetical protein [Brevundimonas sp.]
MSGEVDHPFGGWFVSEHGVATPEEVEAAFIKLAAEDAVLSYRVQGYVASLLRTQPDRPEGEEPAAWRYKDAWGRWAYCQAVDNAKGPTVITEKQPLYTRPSTAEAERDGLKEALQTALEHFDATSKMCPFNRSPTPPKDKPCPTCRAEKSEGCRREITGAFGFVYSARQALAALNQQGRVG